MTAANIFLKMASQASTASPRWTFILLFAAGNAAGLVAVLSYTGLLRTLPLHIAFPLSRGAGSLGVQVFAAAVLFRETFTLRQGAAVVLVTAGIVLIGTQAQRARQPGRAA